MGWQRNVHDTVPFSFLTGREMRNRRFVSFLIHSFWLPYLSFPTHLPTRFPSPLIVSSAWNCNPTRFRLLLHHLLLLRFCCFFEGESLPLLPRIPTSPHQLSWSTCASPRVAFFVQTTVKFRSGTVLRCEIKIISTASYLKEESETSGGSTCKGMSRRKQSNPQSFKRKFTIIFMREVVRVILKTCFNF